MIGLGAKGSALAKALVRGGVRTRAALLRSQAFDQLPAEARANVRFTPVRSMPLPTAQSIAGEVARRLRWGQPQSLPGVSVIPVGSVRRLEPRAADVDLLVVSPRGGSLPAGFLREAELRPPRSGDLLTFADTYSDGPRHRALMVRRKEPGRPARHYRLDLFAASRQEEPYALYHYTGPARYNVRTRALAKRKGWRLNQYGLFDAASGRPVAGRAISTEADLAARLGVRWREPPDRK